MATATKKATTFDATCPHCHDEDATLSVNLNDLEEITCSACDEVFSAREACGLIAAELARWEKVARWVEAAGAILAAE